MSLKFKLANAIQKIENALLLSLHLKTYRKNMKYCSPCMESALIFLYLSSCASHTAIIQTAQEKEIISHGNLKLQVVDPRFDGIIIYWGIGNGKIGNFIMFENENSPPKTISAGGIEYQISCKKSGSGNPIIQIQNTIRIPLEQKERIMIAPNIWMKLLPGACVKGDNLIGDILFVDGMSPIEVRGPFQNGKHFTVDFGDMQMKYLFEIMDDGMLSIAYGNSAFEITE